MTVHQKESDTAGVCVDTNAVEEFRSKYAFVVSSFPRSGTHLLLQLFHYYHKYLPLTPCEYANSSHEAHGFVGDHIDWPMSCLSTLSSGTKICGHLLFPTNDPVGKEHIKKFPRVVSFFKRYGVEYNFATVENALNSRNYVRAIFIYRDPRDILISYAALIDKLQEDALSKLIGELQGDALPKVESIAQVVSKCKDINEKLLVIIESTNKPNFFKTEVFYAFDGWRQSSRTLSVRYEDIIGPLGEQDEEKQRVWLKKILDWAGLSDAINGISIDTICRHMSSPQVNKTGHFRKGVAGQWREIFNNKTADIFEERFPGLVERWGYSW